MKYFNHFQLLFIPYYDKQFIEASTYQDKPPSPAQSRFDSRRLIFFQMIDDSHRDKINTSLITVHGFDDESVDDYVGK